jgi:hypothetical protein
LFLAAVVSVSMSTVLRGAKKVASEHWFWWQVDSSGCSERCSDSSCVYLLPGSHHTGPLIPQRFCSTCLFVLPASSMQFIQCYHIQAVKLAKKAASHPDLYKRFFYSPPRSSQHRSIQSFPPFQPMCTHQGSQCH